MIDVTDAAELDQASAIVKALGDRLGLEGLELDEDDSCTLRFGEALEVTMQLDDDAFVLSAEVGVAPAPAEPAMLEALLEANLFWSGTGGATLSMDPSSRRVFLHERCLASALAPDRLETMLERFVNAAESWAAKVSEGGTGQDAGPENDADMGGRPVWG